MRVLLSLALLLLSAAPAWACPCTPQGDPDGDGLPSELEVARGLDPLDPAHTGFRHRGSLDLTFWPTEFSRLRLQGSGDFPEWLDTPIWAGFLSLEVVVGSHPAHRY